MTINPNYGNTLTIKAVNQSQENVYVDKVEINGKVLDTWSIKHSDIVNGGEIKFHMSNKPKL